MTLLIIFAAGLFLGSFANVCIYRIPRGESIVSPASHCVKCGRPIKWFENVPLLSFILLCGKCAGCGARISFRYPAVELITGLAFLFVGMRFGLQPITYFFLTFTLALIIISGIDFTHQVIPDAIAYAILILGLASSWLNPLLGCGIKMRVINSASGAVIGFLIILLIMYAGEKIFKKEAMGGGDAKLLAGIGAFAGCKVIDILIIASVLGSIFGVYMLLSKRIERRGYIPFGPFLAAAAYISFFLPGSIFSFFL